MLEKYLIPGESSGYYRRDGFTFDVGSSVKNAGDIARKFIKVQELLSFIRGCFIVSTVNALQIPMISASMVLCDRNFWGINYPVGATNVILENGKAVGLRLSNGKEFFARTVISNATRWDTFGKILKDEELPEKNFQKNHVKAPSFLSIHMGVKASVLPAGTDCHHFVLE
ncbi:hypothetical protein ACP70R_042532 [Stipagrostis hirtigluma subsp. patula]